MVIRTFEDYIILQYDLVERGGKMKKTLIIIAVLVLLFSGCAVLNSSVDKSNEDVSFSVSKSTTKENAASQHIESNTSANIVKTELDTTNANTTSQIIDTTTVDVTAKKIVDKSADKKTSKSTTSKPVKTTKSTTTSKQQTTKKVSQCSNNNNHSMKCGNMGRWFDSKSDVKAYVDSVMKSWADKWESGEISDDEYFANCPQGYECWSCGYCGKWTGNFK